VNLPGEVSFSAIQQYGKRHAFFSADARFREGDVAIYRYAGVAAPSASFGFDLRRHTATVAPPAPFSGQATLTKGSGGSVWSGDLAVELPGAGTVALTGPGIGAELYRGAVIFIGRASREPPPVSSLDTPGSTRPGRARR
jgi:hypothetical protein